MKAFPKFSYFCKNNGIMDIQNIKLDLIKWLADMHDPKVIMSFLLLRKEVEEMEIKGELKQMTKEELVARAIASNHAIEKGDLHDVDKLAKEYL